MCRIRRCGERGRKEGGENVDLEMKMKKRKERRERKRKKEDDEEKIGEA